MEKSLTNFLLCGASIWRWISKKHMYKFHLNIKTCWSIILRECAFAFTFPLIGKREKVMQTFFWSEFQICLTCDISKERWKTNALALSSVFQLKETFRLYNMTRDLCDIFVKSFNYFFFVSSLSKLQTAERYHNWRIQKEKLDLYFLVLIQQRV